MDISLDNLKKQFEEDPMAVIGAAATAAMALVGVGNMMTNARNSRTWRKEVKRREKLNRK